MKMKSKVRSQKSKGVGGLAWCLVFTFACLLLTFDLSTASAAPTQEDVFRSISNNVGPKPGEGGKGLAMLLCGAGGLILLVLLAGSRARRQAVPQPLNHSRKLMREVMKAVPLRRGEVKQLKLLADAAGADGGAGPVESPLTLLLCPSVLARALKSRPAKVDRAVIARVVKKMGLAQGTSK